MNIFHAHRVLLVLVLIAGINCVLAAATEVVQLRIFQKDLKEKAIDRETLIKVKQFILQKGKRKTYCNMYNDNPFYETKGFEFYLDPDSGQENDNCDLKKSDFNNLTIHKIAGGRDQYRHVRFLDSAWVYIESSGPSDELTILQIRQFVTDALKEILDDVDKGTPLKSSAADGK